MKQLFILLSVAFFALQGKAQDKLIIQKGDVKTVYNVEVGANKVFYTLEKKENAPIQQIAKKDVLTIIHHDGTKELFNAGESVTSPPPTVQPTPATAVAISNDDKAINDSLMTKYNGQLVTYINDKVKEKKKTAYLLYLLPGLKKGSLIGNANIEMDIKVVNPMETNHTSVGGLGGLLANSTVPMKCYYYHLVLKNKTDKTIYIDLGNTFFMRGSESSPYYIPSSTSSTSGKEGGVGLNVGSVAGALGIGGVAGALANGVNVGGGVSSSSTTTTYTQRIVAIPPMSTKRLPPQLIFPMGCESLYSNLIHVQKYDKNTFVPSIKFENKNDKLKAGETRLFDENNSPINFGSYISYSFDENCTIANHLNAGFYVHEAIGYGNASWGIANQDNDLSANYKNSSLGFSLNQ